MINIAIVDDNRVDLNEEVQITEEYFRKKGLLCRVEPFEDPDWMIRGLKEEQYDIYIMDIRMEKMDGIEAAKRIRAEYPEPIIIFATNYQEYAIEAYKVNTWRYIQKRKLKEKLTEAYDALMPRLLEQENEVYVIEKKSNVEKIFYDDIYYMEKDERYTVIHCRNGQKKRVRKAIGDVYQELATEEFIRLSKGFIVNLRHVMSMQDHCILLRNGETVVVGASKLTEVRKRIASYWRRRG